MKTIQKTLLLVFILSTALISCSKDDETNADTPTDIATTATPTDFKSILTNNNSKEWRINDCTGPYYFKSILIAAGTTWTFKNDNTGNISYNSLVDTNFTWAYNETTKTLIYTELKTNKVTSIYIVDFNTDAINASKIETFLGNNFVNAFSTAEIGCAVGFKKK